MILNIQEARKFTLGQKMTVLVSHTVSAVLEAKGWALALSTKVPEISSCISRTGRCGNRGH